MSALGERRTSSVRFASSLFRRHTLDNCHYFSYKTPVNLAHVKDLPRRHVGAVERGRCPRAELQTAPGQLWASAFQHYRLGREVLAGLGQVRAGNARTNCVRIFPLTGDQGIGALPRPRKHGLELGLWDDESPRSEPRWNADRCAHPAGCAAVPSSTARGSLRLSAFRFLYLWRGEVA
jgi:hypothetical protein